MDGEAQSATAQISVIDTLSDHTHDEAMPLVRIGSYSYWALQAQGRIHQRNSIHYPLRESLLRDRMPLGTVTEDNKELFRSSKRVSVWPECVLAWPLLSSELSLDLFPGMIPAGWGTVRSWRNWPWAPGALGGWGDGFCAIVAPPLTGPEWASHRGSWECVFPSVLEGKELGPCTS